jgi:glycosyltransferase involved in cell wall biosynthesis
MRICMLLHKSVVHDSRVRREASALASAGHEVIVLELADVPEDARRLDGFARSPVSPPESLRRCLPRNAYRALSLGSFVRRISTLRPDAVHAHDAAMLLPAMVGAGHVGARLVYDSHELATGVPYRERAWAWIVAATERLGVRRADAVITVSDGIADRLAERYGLSRRPIVVRNACDLPRPDPAVFGGALRATLGIDDEPLVLHQGSPAQARGCETLIRAFARLDGGHLVFLGAASQSERTRTLAGVAAAEGIADRTHFLPSVPLTRLLTYTSDADVGVSLLEDNCENHRLALPNKVFEYVAAGIPVVASALPELSRLISTYGIGWVADPANPDDVAAALRQAIASRGDRALAERVDAAATALSWQHERERLLAVYEELDGV